MENKRYSNWVKYWLITGCILLFFQVVIGGITRITGSGLSITKWEIITGTFPPLSHDAWMHEFDLYKETPQYEKINQGLSLSDFKFIYFWEYFHRLWARSMGLIFLFPFIFFVIKRMIDWRLIKNLGLVIFFAFLAAIFGWIMVASGLVNRPWVNAYKLTLHLSIALTTLGFMYWTTFIGFSPEKRKIEGNISRLKKLGIIVTIVLCVQIFLGGIMSGLRAGLIYPTWPDMQGVFIPAEVYNFKNWTLQNFIDYDKDAFVPAVIHVFHRTVAYFLFGLSIYYFIKVRKLTKDVIINKAAFLFIILVSLQVLLGILTVINCKGSIPIFYGVMHQAVAILLLGSSLYLNFQFNNRKLL